MLGSNSPSLSSKWNISKTCLQSFDHVDLSITTNNTRVLGSTEYQLGTSSLISNTSLYTVMTSTTTYPVEASLTINTSSSPDTFSSDFLFYLDDYVNLNVSEKSKVALIIDIPWSISGSSSITYSLISIGTKSVPSWVMLNSSDPKLFLSTPDVNENTHFTFGVQSTINSYNYVKNIKLQVIDSSKSTSTPVNNNAIYSSYFMSGFSIISEVILIFTGNSTSSAIWMLINVYQMMLLLPLTGVYIHLYVVEYIKGLDIAILSFSLPYNGNYFIKLRVLKYFEWSQQNDYLYDIGLQSWSTIINISTSLLVVILILGIHLFVLVLYLWTKYYPNWFTKLILKILKTLTFSVYIRMLLELFLLFSISSSQELYSSKMQSTSSTVSFWISLTLLLLLGWFSVLILVYHSKSLRNNFEEMMYFIKWLYDGFKQNSTSRLYFFVFTLRRIALTCWVSFSQSLPMIVRIIIYLLFEIPSLLYVIIWRPYLKTKENICEILNEIIYSLIWIFLVFVNSESQWSNTLAFIIISILYSNSLLIFLVILVCLIKTLWSKLCKYFL